MRPREAKPLARGRTDKRRSQDSKPGLVAQGAHRGRPEKGLFGVCQGPPQNVPGAPLGPRGLRCWCATPGSAGSWGDFGGCSLAGGGRAPHLREAEAQPRPAVSLSVSLSLGLCLSPCPCLCSAHPWSPCLCRSAPRLPPQARLWAGRRRQLNGLLVPDHARPWGHPGTSPGSLLP